MLKPLFILTLFVLPCQAQNESWSTARWNRWVREMIITNSPALSWTNMANIPAGFADGVDNTGGSSGGGLEQTNISHIAVTNAPWQRGTDNLTNWSALAPTSKQDASANLTAWSGVALFDTNGVNTKIDNATNSANTVELARIVSATNNLDAAKVTVGNLSVNRLNGGTSASSSTYWRGDGTWATPAGGGGSYRTKLEMTTNFVNAHAVANTLTNIPELSFAVTSGTTYKYRAIIYFTTAATTTGSRWTVTGPTMTAFMGMSEYTLTATTSTRNAMVQNTNLPAAANLTSAAGANMAFLTGIFRPSASGTVRVAFSSEILSSAVTAQAGSTLEYW